MTSLHLFSECAPTLLGTDVAIGIKRGDESRSGHGITKRKV